MCGRGRGPNPRPVELRAMRGASTSSLQQPPDDTPIGSERGTGAQSSNAKPVGRTSTARGARRSASPPPRMRSGGLPLRGDRARKTVLGPVVCLKSGACAVSNINTATGMRLGIWPRSMIRTLAGGSARGRRNFPGPAGRQPREGACSVPLRTSRLSEGPRRVVCRTEQSGQRRVGWWRRPR
jgi:hypothetical protein